MKKLFIIPITLLIMVGCAKKPELITPEISAEVIEVNSNTAILENNIIESITEDTTGENIIEPEPLAVEEIFPLEGELADELPAIAEISEPQTSIKRELDFDQLFPDSLWIEYMTKRGDYLSLIAYKEYNNANEWRRIYQWNRENW